MDWKDEPDTTWREEITEVMRLFNETWDDVEAQVVAGDLDEAFYSGFGAVEGCAFTVWTKNRVYFPVSHDGSEWCSSVPRHPDGTATNHIGGG